MLVPAFTTTIEIGTTTIVCLVQQLMMYEERQSAEEGGSVERREALFHVGKGKGMLIPYNVLKHHLADGCGAYACSYQNLLFSFHSSSIDVYFLRVMTVSM